MSSILFHTICFHLGLLEETINQFDSSATIKAKMFYKSCMNICKCLYYKVSCMVSFIIIQFIQIDEFSSNQAYWRYAYS